MSSKSKSQSKSKSRRSARPGYLGLVSLYVCQAQTTNPILLHPFGWKISPQIETNIHFAVFT